MSVFNPGVWSEDVFSKNVMSGSWDVEVSPAEWLLATGYWNDNGVWFDTETWDEAV